MKKLAALFVLIVFGRFAFGNCDTASVTITATKPIVCFDSTGTICAPTGYNSYLWSDGETTNCIIAIPNSAYSVTVRDDSGCIIVSNQLTLGEDEPPFYTLVTFCYPGEGFAIIQLTGLHSFDGPVTYQWYLDSNLIVGANTDLYMPYFSGNYSISMTDAVGCSTSCPVPFDCIGTYSVCIGLNQFISAYIGLNQTVCSGSLVTLPSTVYGGIPPYSYQWSSTGDTLSCNTCPNPQSIITQNSSFSVTVTDGIHQTVSASVYYSLDTFAGSIPQLAFTSTNISCLQPVDTTNAIITGGIPPVTINWGDGVIAQGVYSPAGHNYGQGGVYVITVSDSAGCTTSAIDTIQNNGVSISVVQEVYPECLNADTGEVTVTGVNGTPPYTYLWSNGVTIDSVAVPPGQLYSVTVTDAANCTASQTFQLPALDGGFYVFPEEADANCSNNGSATADPQGGIAPYQYIWNNNATTQTITGLSPGNYAVTATDYAGCSSSGWTTVNRYCRGYMSGIIFIDSNSNCIFDSMDQPVYGLYVSATSSSGQSYYGMSDNSGNYIIAVDTPGTYALEAGTFLSGSCSITAFCGDTGETVTVAALGDTVTNNNFTYRQNDNFNLTVYPYWTFSEPGFQTIYWIAPVNLSFSTFTGTATLVFTYDSNLTYLSSLAPLPAVDTAAHTLTWVLDSVAGSLFAWMYYYGPVFQNTFLVSPNVSRNYLLQTDFYILPVIGDCDTANNHLHFSTPVSGPLDPNEKTVEPAGQVSEIDSVLTYTINFQNTGTDSTNFVIVMDTLSPNLNPATVQNLASSNQITSFSISGKGVLKWIFNPLHLPDSAANPSGSKGFITFSVHEKSNLPNGTFISNAASIYFDYNPPVKTNVVTDTVIAAPVLPNPTPQNITVFVYPNPFSDAATFVVQGTSEEYTFELYDVMGRLQRTMPNMQQTQFKINRDELTSGVYFYRILIDKKQVVYGKLIVD